MTSVVVEKALSFFFAFSYRVFVIYCPFSHIPDDGSKVSYCRLESSAPGASLKPSNTKLIRFRVPADFIACETILSE